MIDKKKLFEYTGDISQVFYAKQYRLSEGRSDGVRAVDVVNGHGLELTVILDRCLDIGRLSCHGINCAHISKTGIVHPSYYDDKSIGGLKTFSAGFLTTCGLKNVGSPAAEWMPWLGIHGGIGNCPAENVCIQTVLETDEPYIQIAGEIQQTFFMGSNLRLHREIRVMLEENTVYINDKIENRGFNAEDIMILYHFNMGYPLLDEDAYFATSGQYDHAMQNLSPEDERDKMKFQLPTVGYSEKLFFYQSKTTAEEGSFGALINKRLNLAAVIWTNPGELPILNIWKNPRAGDYVLGIEPANCYGIGLDAQRREYGIEELKAQETKHISVKIELAGEDRISQIEKL